jgi:hypothetical protein
MTAGRVNRMVAVILSAQEKARLAEHDAFRSNGDSRASGSGVAHGGKPLMAIRLRVRGDHGPGGWKNAWTRSWEAGDRSIVRGLLTVAAGSREDERMWVRLPARQWSCSLSEMFRDIDVHARPARSTGRHRSRPAPGAADLS